MTLPSNNRVSILSGNSAVARQQIETLQHDVCVLGGGFIFCMAAKEAGELRAVAQQYRDPSSTALRSKNSVKGHMSDMCDVQVRSGISGACSSFHLGSLFALFLSY